MHCTRYCLRHGHFYYLALSAVSYHCRPDGSICNRIRRVFNTNNMVISVVQIYIIQNMYCKHKCTYIILLLIYIPNFKLLNLVLYKVET